MHRPSEHLSREEFRKRFPKMAGEEISKQIPSQRDFNHDMKLLFKMGQMVGKIGSREYMANNKRRSDYLSSMRQKYDLTHEELEAEIERYKEKYN